MMRQGKKLDYQYSIFLVFSFLIIPFFIDFLIEPVAPELRLWIFPRSGAGLMNFFGWVLTSGLMQFLLVSKVNPVKNDTALSIVVLQIVFFASFQIWPINFVQFPFHLDQVVLQ